MIKILNRLLVYSILFITLFYYNNISNFITNKIIQKEPPIVEVTSEYKKEDLTSFVANVDSFIPYSYQDLLNIIYTTMNNGWTNFTFYCAHQYEECINDAIKISKDDLLLSHINNFVHPFNGYSNVKLVIADSGEINIQIDYVYDQEMIRKIDSRVDEIISEIIRDDMKDYDKLKTVHDYIINNAKYDVDKLPNETSEHNSEIAYGPLFNGLANCSGYSDLAGVFLDKLGFKNFKVSVLAHEMKNSDVGHVWNVIYYDNKWVHMDITWDDPVDPEGRDRLEHNYFLLTSKELETLDKTLKEKHEDSNLLGDEHKFNKYIYFDILNWD